MDAAHASGALSVQEKMYVGETVGKLAETLVGLEDHDFGGHFGLSS